MLVLRRRRRVITALREERPGAWVYSPKQQAWISEDRKERVDAVSNGGCDLNGDIMPGVGYYVYSTIDGAHLGEVYP